MIYVTREFKIPKPSKPSKNQTIKRVNKSKATKYQRK